MFASGSDRGNRSMPAHLRSAFEAPPIHGLPSSSQPSQPSVKPSERFARPGDPQTLMSGQPNWQAPVSQAHSMAANGQMSADSVSPLPPPKPSLGKQARPPLPEKTSRKSSFFGLGKKEKSPSFDKAIPLPPVVPAAVAAAPVPPTLPPAPAAVPAQSSRFEPALAMNSTAVLSSFPTSSPSMSPPARVLSGYSQPSQNTSYGAFATPTSVPRSVSQPVSGTTFESPLPRSPSAATTYSPMAAFLGTFTPSSTSYGPSSTAAVPSTTANGLSSPGSTSDAETVPRKDSWGDSPKTGPSTPATSEGGHAEPLRKPPLASSEDLLSRFAPRPMLPNRGGAGEQASASVIGSSEARTIAAPITTSYIYAGPFSPSPVAPQYASRMLPEPSRAEAGMLPLQHQVSTGSQSTVVSDLRDAALVRQPSLPPGAAPSRSSSPVAPFVASSTPSPPPKPAASEQLPPQLASPFATQSWTPQASTLPVLAAPQPKPSLQRLALAPTPSAGATPAPPELSAVDITSPAPDVPLPGSPTLLMSNEKPTETRLTRMSSASRETRERLSSLYAELEVTTGRSSPALSSKSGARQQPPAAPAKPANPFATQLPASDSVPTLPGTETSASSSVGMSKGGSEGDISAFESSSRISSIEVPHLLVCFGEPRFEYALSKFPRTILYRLVDAMDWADLRVLRETSKQLRAAFEVEDTKEYILERYLGKFGYRSMPTSDFHAGPSLDISLRDLEGFLTGREFAPAEFAELAREHSRNPLDYVTVRMINSSMRAHNRVVMRCRTQGPPFKRPQAGVPAIYRDGRAACLRVWVPLRDGHWMQDDEVVQCEKEVWRAGVWSMVQRGDVVWNMAQGDFANEGKLISDSKYLRDLMYVYDHVGHLPNWLNAMTFSPGYWHNVLSSSESNHPVIYACLKPWAQQLQSSLVLCKENVQAKETVGRYRIQRYLYRAAAEIKPGTLIGLAGQGSGSGPGGIDSVHDDWVGQIYVETEGTTEHAQELIRRVTSSETLTPFRILREKSRLGKLVVRPVFENERIDVS